MRRIVLIAAFLAFTASCLYVPWRVRTGNDYVFIGYAPLWSGPRYRGAQRQTTQPKDIFDQIAPEPEEDERRQANYVNARAARATPDFGRIVLQAAGLAAITGLAMLIVPKRPPEPAIHN
jgi:hypothetical protein